MVFIEKKRIYSDGEFRILKKFLFVPLSFINHELEFRTEETRWLEIAYIFQKFSFNKGWVNIKFLKIPKDVNITFLNNMFLSVSRKDREFAFGIINENENINKY